MTILTSIPNGASGKDVRDTMNDTISKAKAAADSVASTKLPYVDMLTGGTLGAANLGKQTIAGGAVAVPLASAYENGDVFVVCFAAPGSLTGAYALANIAAGSIVRLLRHGTEWLAFPSGGVASSGGGGSTPTPTPASTYEAAWLIVDPSGTGNGSYKNFTEWKLYTGVDQDGMIPVAGNTFATNTTTQGGDASRVFDNDPSTELTIVLDSAPGWAARKFASPARPLSSYWYATSPYGPHNYQIRVGAWADRGSKTAGVLLSSGQVPDGGFDKFLNLTYPAGA